MTATTDTTLPVGARRRLIGTHMRHTFTAVLVVILAATLATGYGQTAKPGGKTPEKKAAKIAKTGKTEQGDAGRAEYKKGVAAYEKKEYKDAVKSFKAAAEKGDTDAMILLSVCLDKGRGIEKDEAESRKMLKKAADAGNPYAQAFHGTALMDRDEEKEGVKYLKKSADQGNILGRFLLGASLINKKGEEKEGFACLKKVADLPLSNKKTVIDYADDLLSFMDDEDFPLELDKENMNGENMVIVISQFMVGMAYVGGAGVEEDLDEAKKWLLKSKKNGFSAAGAFLDMIESLSLEE